MKKIIFMAIIVFLYSQCVNAQNEDGFKIPVKDPNSLQEIHSKLLDEFGMKNIQFVKIQDGKYIHVKIEEVKKISDVKGILESDWGSTTYWIISGVCLLVIIGCLIVVLSL